MKSIAYLILSMLIPLSLWAKEFKTGVWRFEIRQSQAVIPFLMEINLKGKRVEAILYNGGEKIVLKDIVYAGNKLTIPLQLYEASLDLTVNSSDNISGVWTRHNKRPKQTITVLGKYGVNERFPVEKKPSSINLSGKWSMTLTDSEGKNTPAVGVFNQTGNYVSGSILTPTGDYRFIEGYVSGKTIEMATFDGVYNFLIKAEGEADKFQGELLSSSKTKFVAFKNEEANLPDAFNQTQLETLTFSLPDAYGKKHSLTDIKYKDKVVIVQIFGSWCPNCVDEMNFLIPWYKENQKRGVEIVALAFERSFTEDDAKRQLIRFQKKKSLPYPLLLAGATSDVKPVDKLPGIKNFQAFPTTIFLNKKHEVVKVHTGFTGPGTGAFYETYKKEFNDLINSLLK
jgi:thiol-disulfide isomerase/thioredoxin